MPSPEASCGVAGGAGIGPSDDSRAGRGSRGIDDGQCGAANGIGGAGGDLNLAVGDRSDGRDVSGYARVRDAVGSGIAAGKCIQDIETFDYRQLHSADFRSGTGSPGSGNVVAVLGNGYRRQNADDGDHNHQLNQCEAFAFNCFQLIPQKAFVLRKNPAVAGFNFLILWLGEPNHTFKITGNRLGRA